MPQAVTKHGAADGVEIVGVIGAGVMGRGVATAVARAGLSVVLVDRDQDTLRGSEAALRDDVRAAMLLAADGSTSLDEVLGRITLTTDLAAIAGSHLVIENVTERWDIKKPVYEHLDTICGPDVLVAINTSAIPITRLASLIAWPSRVIGMHFMNPAAITRTVEVIRGHHTTDETVTATVHFLGQIHKAAIVVNDSPGFVTNRTMMLTINEAIFTLQENVATADQIDRLFVECFGHTMGPLETADLIGLDTVLLSIEVLHDAFKDSKYRPCPLLTRMVDAGLHGRKCGQGFFSYRIATA